MGESNPLVIERTIFAFVGQIKYNVLKNLHSQRFQLLKCEKYTKFENFLMCSENMFLGNSSIEMKSVP